ncbi:MAG: substrate-binding domain-containing protein [Nitrososphaeria archaeon]
MDKKTAFVSKDTIEVKPNLMISKKGASTGLDEEGATLLQEIRKHSSIALAAKHIGRDYRLAWVKVNVLEKAFGFKIIDRSFGGFGGGGAKLSLNGELLLQNYLLAQRKLDHLLKSNTLLTPDLLIMGSHCYALEELIVMMEKNFKDFFVEYINVGSGTGLRLVLQDLADLAGVHLFDRRNRKYNLFLIKAPYFKGKLALINGYYRCQGLMIRSGNPKRINSIEDLIRNKIVFINRNKGSGTRILLDELLQKLSEQRGIDFDKMVKGIRGYQNEVRSHFEVAMAIKNGKADVGVGIEPVAKVLGLDFIPLQNERFDFITKKDKVKSDPIKKFISTLTSTEFKSKILQRRLGIQFDDKTGEITS